MSSFEDGIIVAPLVYRHSGLGPISKSSKTVRISSLNHFEAFLLTKQMPKCNELSEDDVTNVTIFQEFGSYLVDVAVVSVGGLFNLSDSNANLKPKSQLGSSTAGEYIGQVRQHFKEKFASNTFWSEDEIWFTKMKKSIVKQIRTRGLRSGEVLSGSAYGLDRGMLDKICDHMMRQTIKSTASMEDRFYMTLTYNACGRGGEAACASFDQMEYLCCEDCMMLQLLFNCRTVAQLPS